MKQWKMVKETLASMITIFFMALTIGTVFWVLYPHIHKLFPTAASNGVLAKSLTWWDAVCIVWIFRMVCIMVTKDSGPRKKEEAKSKS